MNITTSQPRDKSGALGDDRPGVLLAGAAQLMAQNGYHNTSMRDVSRATGSSLAGLYHYFESKEDLLFQLQHRVFSELLDEQGQAASRAENPEHKLRELLSSYLSFYTRNAAELKVCTFELQTLTGQAYERIEVLRRDLYKIFAELVQELAQARGLKLSESRLRHRTLFLFGALNWIFMWFDERRDQPVEQLADELCALLLNGLRGAPE